MRRGIGTNGPTVRLLPPLHLRIAVLIQWPTCFGWLLMSGAAAYLATMESVLRVTSAIPASIAIWGIRRSLTLGIRLERDHFVVTNPLRTYTIYYKSVTGCTRNVLSSLYPSIETISVHFENRRINIVPAGLLLDDDRSALTEHLHRKGIVGDMNIRNTWSREKR